MIQMLCVGPGAGWRRRVRLWWLTSSSTLGCWRRWWAPASSCFTWSSGRSGTGTSGGGTAWPSSASGGSAVCSVPPGFSLSFLLNPQKPSSSSSASLTRYKVSFWEVSPFLFRRTGRAEGQHIVYVVEISWADIDLSPSVPAVGLFINSCCLTPQHSAESLKNLLLYVIYPRFNILTVNWVNCKW